MECEFFVVWNPNGGNPKFRHAMERGAIDEAERLARQNPGVTFYVLRSVTASVKTDVHTVRLFDHSAIDIDQLPF